MTSVNTFRKIISQVENKFVISISTSTYQEMNKKLKVEITILLFSLAVFLLSIYHIKTLNLIFIGLGQSKEGWNVYPPASALNNEEFKNRIVFDPKLLFFEIIFFLIICYIMFDIYRKITKSH